MLFYVLDLVLYNHTVLKQMLIQDLYKYKNKFFVQKVFIWLKG